MRAIEFIKKFGWDLAQRDIAALESGFIKKEDFLEHYGFDILDDLKRYVDAYKLVQSYGGLDGSTKECIKLHCSDEPISKLKQAISIVEEVENYNEKTKEGDPS